MILTHKYYLGILSGEKKTTSSARCVCPDRTPRPTRPSKPRCCRPVWTLLPVLSSTIRTVSATASTRQRNAVFEILKSLPDKPSMQCALTRSETGCKDNSAMPITEEKKLNRVFHTSRQGSYPAGHRLMPRHSGLHPLQSTAGSTERICIHGHHRPCHRFISGQGPHRRGGLPDPWGPPGDRLLHNFA